MTHLKFFWLPASTLVTLALISGLLWGDAVLMGWAHNWGLILLLSIAFPLYKNWRSIPSLDVKITGVLLVGSAWVIYTWTTMASPWLFSAYAFLSLWTGWLAYLLGKSVDADTSTWIKPAFWMAVGILPALFVPAYVLAYVDTRIPEEWVYRMLGFGNIRAIGHFVAICGMAATVWAWHKGKAGWYWWPALTLIWTLGFWSGSRTGLATALMALLGTALICRIGFIKMTLATAVFLVGGALSSFIPAPTHHFHALDRFAAMGTSISEGVASTRTPDATTTTVTGINKASSGRVDMWTRGAQSVMNHPFIGNGLGNWKADPNNNTDRVFFHLHNIILDTLHSFGLIVGSIMLLGLAWAGLRALYTGWQVGQAAAFPTAMILVSAGLSMFDATLWMPLPAGIAGITLGMMLRHANKSRPPT